MFRSRKSSARHARRRPARPRLSVLPRRRRSERKWRRGWPLPLRRSLRARPLPPPLLSLLLHCRHPLLLLLLPLLFPFPLLRPLLLLPRLQRHPMPLHRHLLYQLLVPLRRPLLVFLLQPRLQFQPRLLLLDLVPLPRLDLLLHHQQRPLAGLNLHRAMGLPSASFDHPQLVPRLARRLPSRSRSSLVPFHPTGSHRLMRRRPHLARSSFMREHSSSARQSLRFSPRNGLTTSGALAPSRQSRSSSSGPRSTLRASSADRQERTGL